MPGYQEVFTMNKKLIFLNILLVIGVLLTACGYSAGPMRSQNQTSGIHELAAAIQATEEPPIAFPTIVINPTPGADGGSFPIDPTTLLLYVLVGAVILIALIAVMRR